MQTYQHIQMCLRQHVSAGLVGKFRIGIVLGLLLFVVTIIVQVPGASAQTRTSCSGNDHTYRVVRGDTLSEIAARFGTSWSALASYNRIAHPNRIFSGQTLCIVVQGAVGNPTVQGQQNDVTTSAALSARKRRVVALIHRAFGPYAWAAIRVARCESGFNPYAHNPSGASGVFQIMPGTWAGTSQAGQSPYNAAANITAAHQIFVRDGYSWREWTCKP